MKCANCKNEGKLRPRTNHYFDSGQTLMVYKCKECNTTMYSCASLLIASCYCGNEEETLKEILRDGNKKLNLERYKELKHFIPFEGARKL